MNFFQEPSMVFFPIAQKGKQIVFTEESRTESINNSQQFLPWQRQAWSASDRRV
jgi:hypothetical protein